MTPDPIEPQPLLPISGHVPLAPYKKHQPMSLLEKEQFRDRVSDDSIPWASILLVPVVAIALVVIFYKLKAR